MVDVAFVLGLDKSSAVGSRAGKVDPEMLDLFHEKRTPRESSGAVTMPYNEARGPRLMDATVDKGDVAWSPWLP